jgi:hypothetical protein
VLRRLETRGARYAIELSCNPVGGYAVTEFTHDRQTARSTGHDLASAKRELDRRVESAAEWDSINYRDVEVSNA